MPGVVPIAELKHWLRIPAAVTTHDAALAVLEAAARSVAEGLTSDRFLQEDDFQDFLDGDGERSVFLTSTPRAGISSVSEVVLRDEIGADWGDPETLTDFELAGRELFWNDSFPRGDRTVRVTFDRGYTEGNAPEVVDQAIKEVAGFLWRNRPRVRVSFKGLTVQRLKPGERSKICELDGVQLLMASGMVAPVVV